MQNMPRRSYKPVTYGKTHRNRSQILTNDDPGTSNHLNPAKQQGTSTACSSSGSHGRKLKPEESHYPEFRASGLQIHSPGELSLPGGQTHRFESSLGDGDNEDNSTVRRKRQKLTLDGQGDHPNNDDSTHSAVGFANGKHGAFGKSTGSDDIRAKSGRDQRRNEKRSGRHMSPHTPLQSRPDKTDHRETVSPRKKLVDLLGPAHSSTEEISPVHASNMQLTDASRSHSACPRGLSQKQPTSDSYQPRSYDAYAAENHAPASSSNFRGSRITYGRQRSFLSESFVSNKIEDQDTNPHSKRQVASKATAVFDMPDDDMNDSAGPVRSIHELRQAGDNARFRSAVDCIFEDIADADHSISTRCNGFVQLSSKLLDRQFARRFSEHGFVERLVECVSSDLDLISAFFAFCSHELIHLAGTLPKTHLAALWSKLLDISPRLLDVEDDILLLSKSREYSLSKTLQMSIQRNISVLSTVIKDDQAPSILTPRFLALRCIRTVLWSCQQNNISIKIMPTAILDRLVTFLVLVQHHGPANMSLSPDDSQTILSVLSILETYTILLGTLPVDHQNTLKSLSQLHHFLNLKESQFDDPSRQIRVLYIRVILNLTNNDPSFCNQLITSKLVGELTRIIISEFCVPERCLTEEKSTINIVILALGTLINLSEKSEMGRAVFLTTTNDFTSCLHLLLQKFSANIGLVAEVCYTRFLARFLDSSSSVLHFPIRKLMIIIGPFCSRHLL